MLVPECCAELMSLCQDAEALAITNVFPNSRVDLCHWHILGSWKANLFKLQLPWATEVPDATRFGDSHTVHGRAKLEFLQQLDPTLLLGELQSATTVTFDRQHETSTIQPVRGTQAAGQALKKPSLDLSSWLYVSLS